MSLSSDPHSPGGPPPTDAPSAPRVRNALGETAALFLRLGAVAFGGPYAHVAMMEREAVQRRGWLDGARFAEGMAVCQALPGPLSTQLAIWLGWIRAGPAGAVAGGVCFVLPACLLVLAFSVLYFGYGARVPAVGAAFYGVNPAVIAVMVATGWRMAKSAVKDRFGIALAVLSLALILARAPIALVLLGAGLIGYLRYAPRRTTSGRAAAVFPVLAGTGLGKLAALGWVFLRAGAMLYGGGFVIVAFIEQDVVRAHGWLTRAEFLDGVAIGQVTPGPVLTTATFVGYRVGGVLGAAVATVAVFLPSFVYILAAAPNLDRWRANPSFQAFLKGANPAVVGALFAAAWLLGYGPGRHPVAAVHGLPTALIFAASLVALLRTKVAVPWVLAGAALAGIAARSI